jgi:hypothetical protein
MRLAFAALLLLSVTPAFADAVTYKGTLGEREIVVEIIEPADGPVGGRFAYIDQGGDIPLDPAASPDGMYYFAEEGPCGETACVPNSEGVADMPPRAATWALTILEDGRGLLGTRTSESKKAIVETVELEEVGRRALTTEEPTPFGLHDRSAILSYETDEPLTMDNAAYESVLFGLPKVEGRRQTFNHDTTISYMIDPRTKFEFPRITSLDDGSDPAVMNAKLEEMQNRMSLSALDCLAFVYAAWGQTNDFSYAGGHLADIDQENIEVGNLTPNLISWTQSGSTYCVGAHPYNHYDVYNYNVRTGEPLLDQDVFSAWVPREYGSMDVVADEVVAAAGPDDYFSWGPSQDLIDYVQANTDKVALYGGDQEMLDACATDEALADNLTVRYLPGDKIMFVLSGFPHVIGVCNGDLFAVDALDIGQFLHAGSENLFPSLAD